MPTDPTGRISHLPYMHRGVSWKQACRVATTANGTLASAFANGSTVDGVTLATGDRILLKNQTAGKENGIYTVNASGAPTRAFDMDQDADSSVPASEVVGAVVYVTEGTTNANTIWVCTTTGTPALGTDDIDWEQFTGSSGVTIGTPALTLGTTNAAGSGTTVVGTGATVALFDATAPTTSAVGDSAAVGTATVAARRDHKHGREAFGTTAAAIGTSAGGSATTPSRSDHVHATGAGTPSTQAFGDSAATGTGPAAAMTDHKHAMPSDPTGKPLALTGATAATRYVGATTSGAPASGTFAVGDFIIDQTGKVYICTVAGSPGTWVAVGGGSGSSPLTTKGDLYGFDTADARIAVGTDGQVLSADSSQAVGVGWADTLATSISEATLSADVPMTTANTFYDGPSLSLAAGTWIVTGRVYIKNTTTSTEQPNARIADGTNVYDEAGSLMPASLQNFPTSIPLFAKVTIASTTTIKLTAACVRGSQLMLRDVTNSSAASHTATKIMAYQAS